MIVYLQTCYSAILDIKIQEAGALFELSGNP